MENLSALQPTTEAQIPSRRLLTRRTLLRGLFGTFTTVTLGAADMRWVEPGWLDLTQTRVNVPGHRSTSGVAPLRVLHLSDLHAYAPWVSLTHIARAVELGLRQKPDVICLTGDFITSRYDSFSDYARTLRPLADAAPTFACLGNHDGGPWAFHGDGYRHAELVRTMLHTARVELVHNTARETIVRGRRVQIFGVGDWWTGECHPELAFASAPPRRDAVRLVLNHNPDAKVSFARHDWDLMLCGHTHGGQIGIPVLSRLFAPVQDKRFIAGLYPWEGRQIFITRGVGQMHRARLLCRPEVSLLLVG